MKNLFCCLLLASSVFAQRVTTPGGAVSNSTYGPSWNGVTSISPSLNAVYDAIEAITVGSGDGGNWVADGSTNSTLAGEARVHSLIVTQSFTLIGDGVGTFALGDADDSAKHRRTANATITTEINEIGPPAPISGIPKYTVSGTTNMTMGAAVSGTDYAPATSGTSILKGNGSGGFSNAASGTDYAPATSGTAILKGNGSGGFSAAAAGTDYANTGQKLSYFAATTSAELLGVISDESGSGLLLFGTSPTITTPTISGAITFPDNVRQTFNPGANAAGFNPGSIAGDPDTPSDGDLWYDSSSGELTARIAGSNVALGAGGPGGISSADVQIFTATGANTWTKPSSPKTVQVILIGGGGGGGSGRVDAAGDGNPACGGGGGAGAGFTRATYSAALLGATETVTVGAGGAGGAAQTSDSSNGNNGTAGGQTSFGAWLKAGGGGNGGGGTTAAGTAGSVVNATGEFTGAAGGAASGTGGVGGAGGAAVLFAAAGGAAGGGVSSADAAAVGGAGGAAGASVLPTALTGGTLGNGAPGGNGGGATANQTQGGAGGGGGGGNAAGNGHAGGNGGIYGAGGGGGGATVNGNDSGAGGNGANGIAIVITYF